MTLYLRKYDVILFEIWCHIFLNMTAYIFWWLMIHLISARQYLVFQTTFRWKKIYKLWNKNDVWKQKERAECRLYSVLSSLKIIVPLEYATLFNAIPWMLIVYFTKSTRVWTMRSAERPSHLREIASPWDDHQKKKHFHDVCLNTFV